MYRKLDTLEVKAIDLIERLKDGSQPRLYYHCAIALDPYAVIESNGKTVLITTHPTPGFDAFRPPIPAARREQGLRAVHGMVGQRYDWVLIVDDVLRAFTHNWIRLPQQWVAREERHRKICSTLIVRYLVAAHWPTTLDDNALPEDIYQVLRPYQVETG